MRRASLTLVSILAVSLAAPATAQDVLHIVDDKVGILTDTPGVALHVQGDSGGTDLTLFRLQNSGGNRLDFVNTMASSGGTWQFINTSNPGGADLVIRETTKNATEELRLTETGTLTISGEIVTGGSCSSGCDRVFLPDYPLESIEEHAAHMWEKGHLPGVGPTPEEGPFNLTDKTTGMLNELEKAHIYIDRLHQQIADLEERLSRLEEGLPGS